MTCRRLEGTNILEEYMVPATWHHCPEVTLKFTVMIIIIIIIIIITNIKSHINYKVLGKILF